MFAVDLGGTAGALLQAAHGPLVGVHGAGVFHEFLDRLQHVVAVPLLLRRRLLQPVVRGQVVVDVLDPLPGLLRSLSLELQLAVLQVQHETIVFFWVHVALPYLLQLVHCVRFLLVLGLVLLQLRPVDLEEGPDLRRGHTLHELAFQQEALFPDGAVVLALVDGVLVFVELVEGEGEGAFAGAAVVPVLEEGLAVAGHQRDLFGRVGRVLDDLAALQRQVLPHLLAHVPQTQQVHHCRLREGIAELFFQVLADLLYLPQVGLDELLE